MVKYTCVFFLSLKIGENYFYYFYFWKLFLENNDQIMLKF